MNLRTSTRGLAGGAGGLGTIATVLLLSTRRGRRLVRRTVRRTRGRARHLAGRVRGIRYRLSHGGPSPDVSDAVLAQRIRSTLGPLEKRLDLPHIHVSASNRNVLLHGVAASAEQAQQLEDAVRSVAGVKGVESRLRLGLTRSDTRPSEGRVLAPSDMHRELQATAHGFGLGTDAVATVLTVFVHRLPGGERDHVLTHLPADVRTMIATVAPAGVGRIADEPALVDAVASNAAIPAQRAHDLIRAVLAVLRRRVPEEIADVEAVLPKGLKPLWAHPLQEATP